MPTSDPSLKNILTDKLKILKLRRKSSTKYMKEFVKYSPILREFFTIALQILSQLIQPESNSKRSKSKARSQSKSALNKSRTRSRKFQIQIHPLVENFQVERITDSQRKQIVYLWNKTRKVLGL